MFSKFQNNVTKKTCVEVADSARRGSTTPASSAAQRCKALRAKFRADAFSCNFDSSWCSPCLWCVRTFQIHAIVFLCSPMRVFERGRGMLGLGHQSGCRTRDARRCPRGQPLLNDEPVIYEAGRILAACTSMCSLAFFHFLLEPPSARAGVARIRGDSELAARAR